MPTTEQSRHASADRKKLRDFAHRLIDATNAFDIETALALFAPDAVIEDVSVGDKFAGTAGVRRYLEQFFVGYHTRSEILAVDVLSDRHVKVSLDFTGDFGHETGVLDVSLDDDDLIAAVHAYLD